MAILVPVLSKAKKQTKAIICLSKLRQWGFIFKMYADNNNGYMPTTSYEWPDALESSYDNGEGLLCCPMATKPVSEGGRHPFAAFPVSTGTWEPMSDYESYSIASYGINGWVCNPPPEETINSFGLPTSNNWRKVDVIGASNIPLLLDSIWIDSYPDTTNEPPPFDGDEYGSGPMGSRQIRMFCINRHDGNINGVFLDFSIRKIGLKALWKLKWHRKSDINAPTPAWPDWMKKLKAY